MKFFYFIWILFIFYSHKALKVESICIPPCQNGGDCIGNNLCKCADGFTGNICQTSSNDVDSVANNPIRVRASAPCSPSCKNLGNCLNGQCQCQTGWSGSDCGTCSGSSCSNSGGSTTTCTLVCQNGGKCVVTNNVQGCTCLYGYSGPLCQNTGYANYCNYTYQVGATGVNPCNIPGLTQCIPLTEGYICESP